MTAFCNQGHQNPPGSRFCHLCGEKLAVNAGVVVGMILGDRYRIMRELGAGGFGRTYLAEDINRFNEPCVLKEFAPQVRGTYALQKSEELFEREAGVLYKLQHPQIPRFREMFRADFGDRGHLFLVQDYVDGKTYRQLLDARRVQGMYFAETEVVQLLTQILPVLQYIHSAGVIHRDISPDNLILRYSDQLPVLIDFGGVKRIAAVAASQYVEIDQSSQAPATRLGKLGYAPAEQMQMGRVFPHSDLYALAATVLVLLTDKEPHELLGDGTSTRWQQLVTLSPTLIGILRRMLAVEPVDRYQSASAVIQALSGHRVDSGSVPTQPPISYPSPSQPSPTVPAYAPSPAVQTPAPAMPNPAFSYGGVPAARHPEKQTNPVPIHHHPAMAPVKTRRKGTGYGGLLVFLFLLGALAGSGWWAKDRWLPLLNREPSTGEATNPDTTSSDFSQEEQARKAELRDRRESLGIDSGFLVRLTDATFIERYPEQRGRTLTTAPDDAEWRARWDAIAAEWLDTLEQNLSPEARRRLGRYDRTDREAWKQEINKLYVGSRSLNDLTDAKFFSLFPDQPKEGFIDQPIGQVWQAIAADTVKSLQDGTALDRIRFDTNTFSQDVSDTLEPGSGMIYIANLSEGQIMRLNLQAPRQSTLLSVYVPRPTQQTPSYLEDSTDLTWSGTLTQSGFYEIVIVSKATEPISYTLNVAVDNVTSTPVEPAEPEAPDAKN